eukprot:jgi/Tetstr1/455997/TSEL_042775.t1
MLLHNGRVYEEAPTDIKCVSLGFDDNAVDFLEEYNSPDSKRTWELMVMPGGRIAVKSNDGVILGIIAIYVDDIIIVSNSRPWIAHFKQALGQRFDIKDLGSCS